MVEKDILGDQILEVVENQLKANDPPETKQTFKRLEEEGYKDSEIKQLIGVCVMVEIFDVLKSGKEFDEDRYIKNLNRLPETPFKNEV